MRLFKLSLLIIFVFSFKLFAQIENLKTHSQMNLDCKKCHICDTPTKANPCLVLCPRNKIESVRHSPEEGPDNIVLNEIKSEKDLYQPVDFTHKLHAEMSLMAGGCSTCHHFNPPGKIVKCITCHNEERSRTDISVPDLKAAYHRQCMGCHKTWEEKTECESCHALNTTKKTKLASKQGMENVHPKITIPTKLVYETNSEEGKLVTYFHNDHTSLFGLECTDCHTQESCANCHNQKPNFVSSKANEDEHARCSSCHDTENNCSKCHKNELTKPFDHFAKTGFALTGFHATNDCSSCHKVKNKFTGLKKNCISCHKNDDGLFDHQITGVKLDETHSEFECTDCHAKNNYSVKPSCADCHDDYSFPNEVPGEKVK